MRLSYRGFVLEAHRALTLNGERFVYWSIFREADWLECDCGFTRSNDPLRAFIRALRERVDEELRKANPWGTREN